MGESPPRHACSLEPPQSARASAAQQAVELLRWCGVAGIAVLRARLGLPGVSTVPGLSCLALPSSLGSALRTNRPKRRGSGG